MNDEDRIPVTWDGMAKFMTIFDGHDYLTKGEIHEFGAGRGYSSYQIDGMMENLLDHGYIHEPIKDHFKMLRRIGGCPK